MYPMVVEDSCDYITEPWGCYTTQSSVDIALESMIKAGAMQRDIPTPKHALPHSTVP
jgi:hypothetical protein